MTDHGQPVKGATGELLAMAGLFRTHFFLRLQSDQSLGERFRLARHFAGLTLREASQALNLSNVDLAQFERNEREPTPDVLARVATTYNVGLVWLQDGTAPTIELPPGTNNLLEEDERDELRTVLAALHGWKEQP